MDNIDKLLNALKEGTLIDDLLDAHDILNPGREFPQEHLPSTNIEYYRPVIEELERDDDLELELLQIFDYYFPRIN